MIDVNDTDKQFYKWSANTLVLRSCYTPKRRGDGLSRWKIRGRRPRGASRKRLLESGSKCQENGNTKVEVTCLEQSKAESNCNGAENCSSVLNFGRKRRHTTVIALKFKTYRKLSPNPQLNVFRTKIAVYLARWETADEVYHRGFKSLW